MFSHKSAFIYIAVYTVESSLSGILPHLNIPAITEHRLSLGVLGYHDLVAVELAEQVVVVEVGTCIDERFLLVGFLYEMQKLEERVTEFLCRQVALGFHVYHRQQILVTRSALCHEVFQLSLLWNAGTIEMI